jgi:hypothetical protein
LRQIAEVLHCDLQGYPLRIGHGLALDSGDWSSLIDEPIEELLDDLVWSASVLAGNSADADTARLARRLAVRLAPSVHSSACLSRAPRIFDALVGGYERRAQLSSLLRIGFLRQENPSGRLVFLDGLPTPGDDYIDDFLVERMTTRDDAPLIATVSALHDGELGPEQLRSVLEDCYVRVRRFLVPDLRTRGVVIECCPTSNVVVGGVRGYDRHPIAFMLLHGLRVTVNSDDPMLFHSFLGEEFASVWDLMVTGQATDRVRVEGLRSVRGGG